MGPGAPGDFGEGGRPGHLAHAAGQGGGLGADREPALEGLGPGLAGGPCGRAELATTDGFGHRTARIAWNGPARSSVRPAPATLWTVHPSAAPTPPCPECGSPAHLRAIPPAGLVSWRRGVPLFVVAALLLGIAVGTVRSHRLFAAGRPPPASTSAAPLWLSLPARPLPYEQIEAVAIGERVEPALESLIQGLRQRWTGSTAGANAPLYAAFVKPTATRVDTFSGGWPWRFYSGSQVGIFADAYTRTELPEQVGYAPRSQGYASFAYGQLAWWRSGTTYGLRPGPIALLLALVLTGSAAIGGVAGRLAGPSAGPRARRRWRRRSRIAGLVALCILVAQGLTWPTPEEPALGLLPGYEGGAVATGLSIQDLGALPDTPSAARALARAVIEAAPKHEAGQVMAVGVLLDWTHRASIGTGGWPLTFYSTTETREYRREDGSPVPLRPRPWHIAKADPIALVLTRQSTNSTLSILIMGGELALIGVALWAAWRTAALVCWLAARQRTGRRVRAGRCVACGYPLPASDRSA